jgi:hypothetical protein
MTRGVQTRVTTPTTGFAVRRTQPGFTVVSMSLTITSWNFSARLVMGIAMASPRLM